ncbi:MAG: ribosome biogenesis/translation initiation ATPase RLI [Candidatus Woesearchaeota archaeon]
MAKRIMVVKKEKCNPEGCGGYLCMRVSPSNRAGKEAIVKDSDGKVRVNEDLITDADRIAANKCPFGALQMIKLPEELDEDPIHRYPPNGFALFKITVPMFEKVVGIIGRNGIGKSTSLNIISGILKPNLGGNDSKDFSSLVEKFKGSEAQIFFEKLSKGEVSVALKPQQVDLIPKNFDGKVSELLRKVDEKSEYDRVVSELSLTNILDRHLGQLSGGELQRVAIAATFLKKANLYLFDEPTSYLDVKQRIIVSKFIKNLASEDVAVMLIEHDLIILDFMTDLVTIMYGDEGAFGVSSLPKTTKNGINTYLEGYLKEENMRFRDNSIIFDRVPIDKTEEKEVLVEWSKQSYSMGSFKLNVNEGLIRKGDVVGVLGENGIGKSTFAKIIAGEIEGKTNLKEGLSISYKPQYLEKNDDLVQVYLAGAMKYQGQIIDPLNIKPLFNKTLNQLSGGELQRVAIARCLSEKADLYVLDEPSAYLDIEQRLSLSKIIKNFMDEKGKAAIIIDHDLLFLDYLSKKLLIFEGEPAIEGSTLGPMSMEDGMNYFLKSLNITFRRDAESYRPRINKPGSQKDKEQRSSGRYYYV